MNSTLSAFVKDKYPDSKSDLFACFIEKCGRLVKQNGFYAMITQHAWMFLSSYENLRKKLMFKSTINMAHLGARAFDEIGGEVVQTTAFVDCGRRFENHYGTYVRLVDIVGENEKRDLFLSGEKRFTAKQENFSKIPGMPVAYWVSENFVRAFENKKIGDYALARNGMKTGDNATFVRLWWETIDKFICFNANDSQEAVDSCKKWFPYNKGGEYHKWYGNNDSVVFWENCGERVIGKAKEEKRNVQDYPLNLKFKPLVTWSLITSSLPSFRFKKACICDIAGMSFWDTSSNNILFYLLGICNTKMALYVLEMIAPTINFQAGDIARIPVIIDTQKQPLVDKLVQSNVEMCKKDWDSFETSWNFEGHPLI